MIYSNIVKGKFIERPNRFIAIVDIEGKRNTVHVKNTGRCKEILIPGAEVFMQYNPSPNRKTNYSLISVKKGETIINIDSQVPNKVVYDAIISNKIEALHGLSLLKREVPYKASRFDLYFESHYKKGFVEVKGVTLEENAIAMFPDAPTERGTRHIYEMIDAVKEGYEGYIFFLIQMKGTNIFKPNYLMDPAFSEALKTASQNNVKVLAYDCVVTVDSIEISSKIPIII